MMFNIKINIPVLVILETKIHMVKQKNMYLHFFEVGGGRLSVFLSKDMGVAYTRGAAYTNEYGNATTRHCS